MFVVNTILVRTGTSYLQVGNGFVPLQFEGSPCDGILELVRALFEQRWAADVHALKWIRPSESLLHVEGPGPYLVLFLNSPGTLSDQHEPWCTWPTLPDNKCVLDPLLLEAGTPDEYQPWSFPTWFKGVHEWVRSTLGPPISISQIRVSTMGAVNKISGLGNSYFLKSVPSCLSYEVQLLRLLHKKLPSATAPVFDIAPDANSHLTAAIAGVSLADSQSVDQWKIALHGIASIQRLSTSYVDEMNAIGVPYQPFKDFVANLPTALERLYSMQSGLPHELSIEEERLLPHLLGVAFDDCEALIRCDLPDAIFNTDLNESNIFISQDNCTRLIDWTFCQIGHPFFTLAGPLFATYERSHLLRSVSRDLKDAYLQPWREYSPLDRLSRGLEAAARLITVATAVDLRRYVEIFGENCPGTINAIPRQLRRALRAYELI